MEITVFYGAEAANGRATWPFINCYIHLNLLCNHQMTVQGDLCEKLLCAEVHKAVNVFTYKFTVVTAIKSPC